MLICCWKRESVETVSIFVSRWLIDEMGLTRLPKESKKISLCNAIKAQMQVLVHVQYMQYTVIRYMPKLIANIPPANWHTIPQEPSSSIKVYRHFCSNLLESLDYLRLKCFHLQIQAPFKNFMRVNRYSGASRKESDSRAYQGLCEWTSEDHFQVNLAYSVGSLNG